jgi:pilus assembly protein CpaF
MRANRRLGGGEVVTLRDDVEHLVRELSGEAAERVGAALPGRSFRSPGADDEAHAWKVVSELCEEAQRAGRAPDMGPEGREALTKRLLDELFRLGPLQPYVDDPEMEEVSVNAFDTAFMERAGAVGRERFDPCFASDEEMERFIRRVVEREGRHIDESSPAIDVHLPAGRFHAVLPPLAEHPSISIRCQRIVADNPADLVRLGTATEEGGHFLDCAVRAGFNIVVSGATFTGKTTGTNALCGAIPHDQRVITIEETRELRLGQPNWVALQGRQANIEGRGEIPLRALVREALRMRPDRIIVGEVRGAEAIDMLDAMNSGQDGSLTSIHARSAHEALSKLVSYVMRAPDGWNPDITVSTIGRVIDLVVHLRREPRDARRRVVETITEVESGEGGQFHTNDLFDRRGGELRWRGFLPRRAEDLVEAGWRSPGPYRDGVVR